MDDFYGFGLIDGITITWFFTVWFLHFYLINTSPFRTKTISYTMAIQRERWMLNVVARGDSPIDAILQNGLQQGVNGLQVYVMCELPNNVILAEEFAQI